MICGARRRARSRRRALDLRGILAQPPGRQARAGSSRRRSTRRVSSFLLRLSVVTGILFGLYPAIQASEADVIVVAERAERPEHGYPRGRVLPKGTGDDADGDFAAAADLGRAVRPRRSMNLTRIDLGIRTGHLVTFSVNPRLNRYSERAHRAVLPAIDRATGGDARRDARHRLPRARPSGVLEQHQR